MHSNLEGIGSVESTYTISLTRGVNDSATAIFKYGFQLEGAVVSSNKQPTGRYG